MESPEDDKVIDLVPKIKARAANAALAPEKDLVVSLAMGLLKALREETHEHALDVLTALQVVNNTIGSMYVEHYGKEESMKMLTAASVASRMYEACYTRSSK
jgi:hypothetical protein